jgi:hypothetical protein
MSTPANTGRNSTPNAPYKLEQFKKNSEAAISAPEKLK